MVGGASVGAHRAGSLLGSRWYVLVQCICSYAVDLVPVFVYLCFLIVFLIFFVDEVELFVFAGGVFGPGAVLS